ncbi:MAG: SOS response-associated peptidase [Gammaproteobacteria bacterium]
MCGRFSLWSNKQTILSHFNLNVAPDFKNSYNVIPTGSIPVIRLNNSRQLINCHWGLIPHRARGMRHKPINARAESLPDKPFFRDALRKRRCLIPANGFYEWKGPAGQKQPYFITLKDAELFAFAGLWDHWDSPDKSLDSCTIITTEANDMMAPIHNRMPVIVDRNNYDHWLQHGGRELLRPYQGEMEMYPVSNRVNSPKHDGKELIAPLEPGPS